MWPLKISHSTEDQKICVKRMGAKNSVTNGAKRKRISTFELDDFPDEIILKVLNNLDIKDLLRCAQVCKRINTISQDDYLYQEVNLCEYIIPANFVKKVLPHLLTLPFSVSNTRCL